ncbi:hypothetical protein KPH14_002411 [Odynerus spinipes]|uniref:DUF4781 domain-containing protein n=1 Tax=Odynerus spinipes TaxID=1348599 RepID=A0AAD9VP59_9HYME|nr:hypothetical protein KPH14_002411 [Odynerus spinipes]
MSSSTIISPDEQWHKMLKQSVAYQQDFYELLPDWTVYKKDNIQYLEQNIGYAIFGSPLFEKTKDSKDILNFETRNTTSDTEIHDLVNYSDNAKSIIKLIAEQICLYGKIPGNGHIKCGIIYVMLFQNKRLTQCNATKDAQLISMPIFKILKYDDNTDVVNKNIKDNYTTWYIDIKGRVYQSWDNYIMENNLPECTMVFPKDGYYQPNPNYEITPHFSVVWLTAQDSYACSDRAQTYSMINTTMNTLITGATVGVGAAMLFTPAAPFVAMAGLVTTGVSSAWNLAICSADLYDRQIHKESINPLNGSCLSSWLGIAGITIGISAIAGSGLIKQTVIDGAKVGTIAKTAYNTVLIGNISINLIGLGYKGMQIYNKFQEGKHIDIEDVVYFGTHLLFFMNSVINIQFAEDIIYSTQGEILKNFEANLRDNNLRERYNDIRNKAAADYPMNKTAQNAAVIRYIKKVDIKNMSQTPLYDNCLLTIKRSEYFKNYKLNINGISLLDPVTFVADIIKGYFNQTKETFKDRSNSHSVDERSQITKVLEMLLSDLYTSRDCPKKNIPTTPDFNSIIEELKKIKGAGDLLPFIFNIAVVLLKNSNRIRYMFWYGKQRHL